MCVRVCARLLTPSFLSVRGKRGWVVFGRIEWAQLGASLGCVRVVFLKYVCVCEPVRVCVGVGDGSVVSGVLGPNLWGIVPSCRCACALPSPMRQVHVCI